YGCHLEPWRKHRLEQYSCLLQYVLILILFPLLIHLFPANLNFQISSAEKFSNTMQCLMRFTVQKHNTRFSTSVQHIVSKKMKSHMMKNNRDIRSQKTTAGDEFNHSKQHMGFTTCLCKLK